MLLNVYYPIICSENLVKTVNFYEDFFGYVPEIEKENFVLLKQKDRDGAYLAVISSDCNSLPNEAKVKVSGLVINMPVQNIDDVYEEYYHEGLELYGEPDEVICGRRHFMVRDPNGIFIDIVEQNECCENQSPSECCSLGGSCAR